MTSVEEGLAYQEVEGIVHKVAWQFVRYRPALDPEEVAREGVIPALQAVRAYNSGCGAKLSTWVYRVVVNFYTAKLRSAVWRGRMSRKQGVSVPRSARARDDWLSRLLGDLSVGAQLAVRVALDFPGPSLSAGELRWLLRHRYRMSRSAVEQAFREVREAL